MEQELHFRRPEYSIQEEAGVWLVGHSEDLKSLWFCREEMGAQEAA